MSKKTCFAKLCHAISRGGEEVKIPGLLRLTGGRAISPVVEKPKRFVHVTYLARAQSRSILSWISGLGIFFEIFVTSFHNNQNGILEAASLSAVHPSIVDACCCSHTCPCLYTQSSRLLQRHPRWCQRWCQPEVAVCIACCCPSSDWSPLEWAHHTNSSWHAPFNQ